MSFRRARMPWRARTVVAVALVGLGASALASPAHAGRPLRTAIANSAPFYFESAETAFARSRAAGMSAVRLQFSWRDIAPSGHTRPAAFDAANPADPRYSWRGLDRQVVLARKYGLEPIVAITFAPDWAEAGGGAREGTNSPDPAELGRFASAAAKRFNGRFGGLPRVRYWMAWNEANHFGFLNPQRDGTRSVGAERYRRMVNAFSDSVHAVDPSNRVVAGGTSPFTNKSPRETVTAPLRFMREMFCVSGATRPRATCSEKVRFDIWAHHPYTSGGPRHRAALPDDVSLGDLPEMRRLLSAAQRAGQVVSRGRVRFWVTEFSWDTKPPDPGGVPAHLHARWVAEALYRMWRAGVSLATWYQFRDDADTGAPDPQMFQSGLYFRCAGGLGCDQPKPALAAFRFPFVALPSGRRVLVWGRTPGSRRATVAVEQLSKRGWRRIARLRTDAFGVFQRRLRAGRKARMRARIVRKRTASLPFPPGRTPDRAVNPFG